MVGVRRVGKTSLVKAATYGMPRIYTDARKFEAMPYTTYDVFLEELRGGFTGFLSFVERS